MTTTHDDGQSSTNEKEQEKAKFLYEYSKAQFETELERFKSSEDKSAKFMTLLSIISAGHTALLINSVKYLLEVNNFVGYLCLISMAFTSFALIVAWYFIFKSITFKTVPRLTLDQITIDYIDKCDISATYKMLSGHCLEGLNAARAITNLKQRDLKKGYEDIALSMASLGVSLMLLAVTQFNQSKELSPNVERSVKASASSSSSTSSTTNTNDHIRSK